MTKMAIVFWWWSQGFDGNLLAVNYRIIIGEFPSRTWLKDNKQKFQIMTPQGLEVGQAELNSDNTTLSFPQAWLTKNFQLIRENLSSLIFRNGRADKSRVTWVYFCLVNKRNLCLILIWCLRFQPIVCESLRFYDKDSYNEQSWTVYRYDTVR